MFYACLWILSWHFQKKPDGHTAGWYTAKEGDEEEVDQTITMPADCCRNERERRKKKEMPTGLSPFRLTGEKGRGGAESTQKKRRQKKEG